MRALISAGWLGGAGGAERALHSIARALSDDSVDIVVRERLDGPWARTPPRATVSLASDPRWWGAGHTAGPKGWVLQHVANPVRRRVGPDYDVYLQFLSGASIGSAARSHLRLVIPSGNAVPAETGRRFDAVAMQAPGNAALVPEGVSSVLLPPPVFDLAPDVMRPDVQLPARFVLTVFNPYDPIKGMQELARAVDESPLPIVWCHSQATVAFDIPGELLGHPRIVHVTDATPSQLRFLYETCAAYVSFSLTEGFGWSTADALRYAPAVATRPIGIFSNEGAWQPGTLRIEPDGRVDWRVLLEGACDPSERDLAILDGETFRTSLSALVGSVDG